MPTFLKKDADVFDVNVGIFFMKNTDRNYCKIYIEVIKRRTDPNYKYIRPHEQLGPYIFSQIITSY